MTKQEEIENKLVELKKGFASKEEDTDKYDNEINDYNEKINKIITEITGR